MTSASISTRGGLVSPSRHCPVCADPHWSLLPGDQGKNRHNAHCSYVIRSHLLSSPRHTGAASLQIICAIDLPEKKICCDKVKYSWQGSLISLLQFHILLLKRSLADNLNDQKKSTKEGSPVPVSNEIMPIHTSFMSNIKL